MAIDMTQFYQVFFEESAEHLANMEALLLELDLDDPDPEKLNAIFRAAHSIKGSAGTFGFSDLADTTHILENLLDRIRKRELVLQAAMVDAFLEAGDILRDMLEAHQGRGSVEADAVEAICEKLRQLSSDDEPPAAAVEAPVAMESSARAEPPPVLPAADYRTYDIQFVPNAAAARAGGVESFLEELKRLGQVEILQQPGAAEQAEGGGFWQIRLQSSAPQEAFSEQIDFIADSGAWRITAIAAERAAVDESFGLFDEPEPSPQTAVSEQAYGFFDDPEPPGPAMSAPESPPVSEAYGFFDPPESPAPAQAAPAAEADGAEEAYGFFVDPPPLAEQPPLSEPVISAAAEPLTPAAEPSGDAGGDERGYGFFVPVEPPVSAPVVSASTAVASAPVVEAVEPPVVQKTQVPAPDAKPATDRRSARSAVSAVAAGGDSSIRVSVEKVDQLINLVGELVITQAMLLQTSASMTQGMPEGLVNGLGQLERNTRDLQEAVMSIRMMPISFVFSRFPRVVRDLSSKLGKQVELKTSGETTELDKSLIERIADPLTHLIRNSLDHGIEEPERRIAAGKNPVGTITLKAYHQGGNIVIEVGDDGAGLQRNRILAKARERGMQVSEQMSDQEVFNLIFEAGFSTADQITDVSGRGVGMDVVRRNIQSMGGRVEIDSMPGVGTRMTVRLPLTLAILDGMSVAVGDQTYILPLSYVIESLQPAIGEIKTLSNQARVIQVRGEYLPVVVLHEIFSLKSTWKTLAQGIMVVVEADGTKVALFVDALVGQHQVVIKSLEANYRRVSGISGATIMGDGHVALILDVSAIAEMARSNMQNHAYKGAA